MDDVKNLKWGTSTESYIRLMLRQQDNVCINIFDNYKLKNVYDAKSE